MFIQTSYFFTVVLAAKFYKEKQIKSDKKVKATILIPAHNEETVIEKTLYSIKKQLPKGDNVLVVADNCNDRTAGLIRNFSTLNGKDFKVIERNDTSQTGKGYALDFGVKHLQSEPPEILIIIDADCSIGENAIDLLKQNAIATQRTVQANYLIEDKSSTSLLGKVSTFALIVKNIVRQAGTKVLGTPCILVGSGMAFPWKDINSIQLASANIVEDMQMGIDLALLGSEPIYCHDALIRSNLPTDEKTLLSQRKRWEHGAIQTLLTQAPKLLKEGITKSKPSLIIHALDIGLLPLSLLILLTTGALIVNSFLFLYQQGNTALILSSIMFLQLFVASFIAWWGWGKNTISFKELLKIPAYIFWKIPLYFSFILKREKKWARTERN